MAEAKIKLSIDGVKTVVGGMKEVGDRVRDLTGSISALTAVGGTLSVAAFASMIKSSAEAAGQLNDLSIQTGATVEALSGLASIGKYSDISAQKIAGSMNILAKNMAGATEESKGTGKALEALGLRFDDFKNLRPEQQMQSVAKAMSQFEDGTSKSAVAMALYGKEGAELLPFLKDLAETGDLQAKITTAQAAAADNFGDNLTRLQSTGDAWKKELAAGMIPTLNDALQAFLDVTNGTGGLREEVRKLSADGTIAQWTKNVITGATYVMDAFSGVRRVVVSVGNLIGAYVASIASGFSAIGEIGSHLIRGEFSAAIDAGASHLTRMKSIMSSLGNTLDETWSEETLGQRLRARMAELGAVGTVAQEAKKKLDFVNLADKSQDAKGKLSDYEKLINSIREKIAVQDLALTSDANLTEGEKLLTKVHSDLEGGVLKLNDSQRQYVDALLDGLIAEEKGVDIKKAMAKAADDLVSVGAKEVKSVQEQLEKQREQNAEIGLTKAQIEQLAVAKIEMEAAADRELAANMRLAAQYAGPLHDAYLQYANDLEKAAEAKSQLADEKRAGAIKTASFEAAEEHRKAWEKANEQISQSLTDAIMKGGKSAGEYLKDYFRTLVLRPIVQSVVSPISDSLASAFGGSGGASGTSNLFSMGKTLWDGFSSGFSSMSGTIAQYIQSGMNFLGGSGGYIGQGPMQISPFAQTAGTALSTLGNGATGYTLSKTISNGYQINSAIDKIGAVASMIPGIGPVAGVVSGLLNRAFGRRPKETTSFGFQGNFSDAGFTDALKFSRWQQKGGWFRSDKQGTDYSEMNTEFLGALNDTFNVLKTSVKDFAGTLGLTADTVKGYTKGIVQDLTGNQAKDAEIIANLFKDIGNEMATSLLPNFTEFAKRGEDAATTLQRLATEYQVVDNVMNAIGLTFGTVGLASSAARTRLIDFVGGIDALNAGAAFFAQNFLSEEERLAPVIRQVDAVLDSLGWSGIRTKEQFVALVKSLDLSSEAGAEAYAKLMGIEQAYLQVSDYSKKMADDAIANAQRQAEETARAAQQVEELRRQSIDDARNVLTESYNREADALRSTVAQFQDFSKSLRDFRDSLLTGDLSTLSPEAKYQELRGQFDKTYSLAKAGDPVAMGKLRDVSQQFLEASRGYFASSQGYVDDFEMVRKALDVSAQAADVQSSLAQQQLSSLDRSVSGILKVNDSVISVREALDRYFGAGGTRDQSAAGVASAAAPVDTLTPQISAYAKQNGGDYVYIVPGVNDYASKLAAAQASANLTGGDANTIFQTLFGTTPDAFKNVEAQVLAGIPTKIDGSHADGLDFVPFNGYRAELHYGERVQTASQARQSDEVASLLRQVLIELRADKLQRASVGTEQIARLEGIADKLDANKRELARAA